MQEYKTGKAVVRISGQCDKVKLKKATEDFLKKVLQQKKKKEKSYGHH